MLSNIKHISGSEGRKLLRAYLSDDTINIEKNAWNSCLYCREWKVDNIEMYWVEGLRGPGVPNVFCSETCLNIYILQNNNKELI